MDSHALQELTQANNSFQVILDIPLDATLNHTGDTFKATLYEPLRWGGFQIPKKTRFEGHISKLRKPKRLGRKPYMDLTIDAIYLPNGTYLSCVGRNDVESAHLKLKKEKKNGHRKWIRGTMMAAGMALSLPVSIAAKTGAGAVAGLFEPEFKGKNPLIKMGKGAYTYSPVYTVVKLSSKQPNQHYNAGDAVELALPASVFQEIATLAQSEQHANSIPIPADYTVPSQPSTPPPQQNNASVSDEKSDNAV